MTPKPTEFEPGQALVIAKEMGGATCGRARSAETRVARAGHRCLADLWVMEGCLQRGLGMRAGRGN
jgi:hypothetical protein